MACNAQEESMHEDASHHSDGGQSPGHGSERGHDRPRCASFSKFGEHWPGVTQVLKGVAASSQGGCCQNNATAKGDTCSAIDIAIVGVGCV